MRIGRKLYHIQGTAGVSADSLQRHFPQHATPTREPPKPIIAMFLNLNYAQNRSLN
jgi:hypothetical protein